MPSGVSWSRGGDPGELVEGRGRIEAMDEECACTWCGCPLEVGDSVLVDALEDPFCGAICEGRARAAREERDLLTPRGVRVVCVHERGLDEECSFCDGLPPELREDPDYPSTGGRGLGDRS